MSPPKYVLIRWLGRQRTRWRFRRLVGCEFRLTESLRSEANATAPRIRHAWSHVQLLRCPDRAMPGVSTAFGFLVVNRGGSRHYWVATFKGAVVTDNAIDSFTEFVRRVEPRLRLALVASFGVEVGVEAAAEALAYGWEHWDSLRQRENPAGYLFGVGRNKARRRRRSRPTFP